MRNTAGHRATGCDATNGAAGCGYYVVVCGGGGAGCRATRGVALLLLVLMLYVLTVAVLIIMELLDVAPLVVLLGVVHAPG